MAEPISTTAHGDAALSAAKRPDPEALNGEHLSGRKDDVLVARTVTIDRPRQELYAFWRDFTHLPLFMRNIERVTYDASGQSHWVISHEGRRCVGA